MDIKQLTDEEVHDLVRSLGQKPYRAEQILKWTYKKKICTFDAMTDLPKIFREALKKTAHISCLELLQKQCSEDGTQKFLFGLEDGNSIESVLIPNTKGIGRYTLCISSQAGCSMGCKFCITAGVGFKRNLKAHEIFDQVISAERLIEADKNIAEPEITNIVFMGMGEPFNNFKEVITALDKIMNVIEFAKRKITVSTSGIVPRILEFGEKAYGVNLAVSLNATTDKTRSLIMPVNKKYPIKELLQACRDFKLPANRRITFEYVLLGGLNDSADDARRLAELLKGIRSKINLIPYNPSPGTDELKAPSEESITSFKDILANAGLTAMIRKSMGSDISAACGQLKADYS